MQISIKSPIPLTQELHDCIMQQLDRYKKFFDDATHVTAAMKRVTINKGRPSQNILAFQIIVSFAHKQQIVIEKVGRKFEHLYTTIGKTFDALINSVNRWAGASGKKLHNRNRTFVRSNKVAMA